jgi:hypothetical protein
MAQSISQEAIGATGLPGATAASRHAGATVSGAPTTGTFAVGDYIIDQTGKIYVCSVAGTPGTWVQTGGATTLTYLSSAYGNGTLTNNSFPGPSGTVTNAFSTASLGVGTWLTTFSGCMNPNGNSNFTCEAYVAAGTASCSFSGSYNTGIGAATGSSAYSIPFTLNFITTVTSAGTLILKIYNASSTTWYANYGGYVTGQFWGYTAVRIA